MKQYLDIVKEFEEVYEEINIILFKKKIVKHNL